MDLNNSVIDTKIECLLPIIITQLYN